MMYDYARDRKEDEWVDIHIRIPKGVDKKLRSMGYSVSYLAKMLLIQKSHDSPNILMPGFTFRECLQAIGVTDERAMFQYLRDLFDVPEFLPENPAEIPTLISRNGKYKLVGSVNVFDRVVEEIRKEGE